MATTASRRGCTITVTTNIEYRNNTGRLNAAQFLNLVNGWGASIENMWNGPNGHQHFECCIVIFRVNTRVGRGTANYHQINVVRGPQTSNAGLGPASRSGRWDDQDTGNVAAHESGHLMGLPDEYDYGGPGGAYRNLNPQPAGQPQSIMAQTWGNVAALQTHINSILNGLGASCPWWCCICFAIHRLIERIGKWFATLPFFSRKIVYTPRPSREETEIDKNISLGDLIKLIDKGDPDVLAKSEDFLIKFGKENIGALNSAFNDAGNLGKIAIITALGQLRNPESGPVLERALSAENISVRIRAAQSLAQINNQNGIDVLIEALGSKEVFVGHPPVMASEYASELLASITGQSFGFDAEASETEKNEIINKWSQWWKMNKGKNRN